MTASDPPVRPAIRSRQRHARSGSTKQNVIPGKNGSRLMNSFWFECFGLNNLWSRERLKMAGLDQVPVTDDSKRAQVGNAQTIHESEMSLFYQCIQKCARNVLDSANPVRDGGFS